MCPLSALRVVDRFPKDVARQEDKEKLFGDKTVLMCVDFRQTLPVVPHAGRATTIENCVKSHPQWQNICQLSLTKNIRALETEVACAEFLKQIGNGTYPEERDLGPYSIELPQQLFGTLPVVEDIYGDLDNIVMTKEIGDRAILTQKNEHCLKINEKIMDLLTGDYKTYFRYDKIVAEIDLEQMSYPTEFLNSLTVNGLPPHALKLKPNSLVMLVRYLDTSKALINGTRLRVKILLRNSIDCEVLTGASIGLRVLIPRINLRPSDTVLPFALERTQFPTTSAFAMTMNKTQGQSVGKVGVFLPKPVFGHGQLYVAASRARSFAGLRFYVEDIFEHSRLRKDERIYSKNIVYRELI